MSIFDKKKNKKETQRRDQYFIFMGRWFERTRDESIQGCRPVQDLSEIPEEYLADWSGWKPKPAVKDPYGNLGYNKSSRSSKFF